MPQSAQGQPLNRIDEIRGERHEFRQGNQTIVQEPDRTIIREGNQTIIRHSEGDRFRYGARDVQFVRRGNDNVTTIIRPNGDRIVNIVDENGLLLRRSRFLPDGREIIIIDNQARAAYCARHRHRRLSSSTCRRRSSTFRASATSSITAARRRSLSTTR